MKKKLVSFFTVATLLFTTPMAFAANGDIWKKSPEGLYKTAREMTKDKVARREVTKARANYYFEVDGHLFTYDQADQAYQKDNENFMATLKPADAVKPVPAAELAVASVSAISTTQIKVEFNKEVPHAKLVAANFNVLNSKSQSNMVTATAPSDKDKKTTVVLTVQDALKAGENEPYTLLINKKALDLTSNSFEITLKKVEPKVTDIFVSAADKITVTVSEELTAAPVNADLILTDITKPADPKDVAFGAAPAFVAGSKTKFVVTAGSDFKAGNKYRLDVKTAKLKDIYGNINLSISSYEFTMPEEGQAPKLAKLTLLRDATNKDEVVALAEFDQDVKNIGGAINVTIFGVNPPGAVHTVNSTVVDGGNPADTHIEGLTKVPANQIVFTNVMDGATFEMVQDATYTFKIDKNEIVTLALPAVNNKEAVMDVNGIDVIAPHIVGGTLVSEKEIQVEFNEEVTLKEGKVSFEGFDKKGDATDVEATVDVSGKVATLKPKKSGEIFQTVDTGQIKYDEGVFVDKQGNEIALGGGAVITDVKDEAKPVVAKVERNDTTHKLTITFTEDVSVVDAANAPKMLINGAAPGYDYAGGDADEKWIIHTGKVVLRVDAVIINAKPNLFFTLATDAVKGAEGESADAIAVTK